LIYVVEIRDGLYDSATPGRTPTRPPESFLEGNSNLGDAERIEKSAGP
jgi:hypothetical protein